MLEPTMARAVLILVCAALTSCGNFHVVDPGHYYRCGQLSADGFRDVIEDYGVRTVIRLRGGTPGTDGFEATHTPAKEAGAAFVHIPMTARAMPPKAVLVNLWEAFETAERPILVHCKAGADRTGLASAIYVLHQTGDLRAAREQLHVFPYLHAGWGSTEAMDRVLDMYAPYAAALDFGSWAREVYEDPD